MLKKRQPPDEDEPDPESPTEDNREHSSLRLLLIGRWERLRKMVGPGPVIQQVTIALTDKDTYPEGSPERAILEQYLKRLQPSEADTDGEREASATRLVSLRINTYAQRIAKEKTREKDPYSHEQLPKYPKAGDLYQEISTRFHKDLSNFSHEQQDRLYLQIFDNLRESTDKDVRKRASSFTRDKLVALRPTVEDLITPDEQPSEVSRFELPPINSSEDCKDWEAKLRKGPFAAARRKDIRGMMRRDCRKCEQPEPQYDPTSNFCQVCCKPTPDYLLDDD